MGGLIDTDTGLHFGEGLIFESGLGGPLGLDIILSTTPTNAMITEDGIVMITEDSVIMITEA